MTTGSVEQADYTSLESPANYTRLLDWVSTLDHKKIGIMYILTAVFYLGIGGFEALLMRIQLALPNNTFLGPKMFNQLFTMHGTTMVFLVGMPILTGFANYFVPLTSNCVLISNCFTFPEYRGRGLYSAMLNHIITEMARRRINRFYIDCNDWNLASIRGIQRAGFRLIGQGCVAEKDRLVLSRDLSNNTHH